MFKHIAVLVCVVLIVSTAEAASVTPDGGPWHFLVQTTKEGNMAAGTFSTVGPFRTKADCETIREEVLSGKEVIPGRAGGLFPGKKADAQYASKCWAG